MAMRLVRGEIEGRLSVVPGLRLRECDSSETVISAVEDGTR